MKETSEETKKTKKTYTLTKDGHAKLIAELEDLKNNKRAEIADRIRHAKSHGDLSENAEYDEARRDQSFIEGRIQHLENIINDCQVVERSDVDVTEVGIGCKVTLIDLDADKEETYTIVGSYEVAPEEGKISNVSPIGAELLRKHAGDIVRIKTPKGTRKFRIIKIRRA